MHAASGRLLCCYLSTGAVASSFVAMKSPSRMNHGSTISAVFGSSSGSSNDGASSILFHWFRGTDLRLHDNPALARSAALCGSNPNCCLVPVFCFDPRIYGDAARSQFGSIKCSPKRAQFVIESVADLRQSLEQQGSRLLVALGKPEQVLAKLRAETGDMHAHIVYQDQVGPEERSVEQRVKNVFLDSYESVWGGTLYELSDLPYAADLVDMPNTFTPFRNQVEQTCTIRSPLPPPEQLPCFTLAETILSPCCFQEHATFLPSLTDLGYTADQVESAMRVDPRGVMEFKGGETAALARVQEYIWDKDLLHTYFDTRNGMIGADYSTKFAPWLAHGNLSPRLVAKECKKYEEQRVVNKSTYWVVFELLWRDFFTFFALKHGTKIFSPSGTCRSSKHWNHNDRHLRAWMEGRTGFPLVDANMRELAATGFQSNRGRQNVASFLALELNQDWRYGADYFESTLLDYDVHSNWGNWCCAAGMTGGRLNRFNIVKQSKDYDQHGEYVRLWLPELKNVPTQFVHEPWKMNPSEQSEYNCKLGADYPKPIVAPFYANSTKANEKRGQQRNRKGTDRESNRNEHRGRGQSRDMKSLSQGKFRIDNL